MPEDQLNPLDRTFALLRSLQQPAAVVGNDLASGPFPEGGPTPGPLAPPDVNLPGGGLTYPGLRDAGPLTEPSGPPGRPAEYPVNVDTTEPPPAPRTVDEGTRAVNDQLAQTAATRADYMAKKAAAEQDHATRLVQASEDAAQEQQLVNIKHDRALEMIHARADAETAGWLKDLTDTAKQEPNPGRWWENQSGLGKALWALSMVFGAAHTAITPGAKNAALEMVRQEISNDIARQDARLKREVAVKELKGTIMRQRQEGLLSDQRDRHSRELSRVQALERAWMARAALPTDLDAQAGKAESQAWFEQQKLPLVAGYREELVQARTREEQQRFQAGLQSSSQRFQHGERQAQQKFEEGQKEIDRQLQRDLAQIKVSAKGQVNEQGIPLDEHGIPLYRSIPSGVSAGRTTGLMLLGPDGKPAHGTGEIFFREGDKEAAGEAAKVGTSANEQFQTLSRIRDLLGDQNRVSAIAAGVTDPELNSLLVKAQEQGAREIGGRITNKELELGINSKIGFNPNGGLGQRLKFAGSIDEIRNNIKNMLDEMPGRVNQAISNVNDTTINGQGTRAVWAPVDLNAPQVQQRSENQLTGRPNVTEQSKPVTGEKDYLNRRAIEAGNRARAGMELPEHETDKVDAVIAAAKGKNPDAINRKVTEVLDSLDERIKELRGVTQGGFANPKGEPAREWTPAEIDEMNRLDQTKRIVEKVGYDEQKRAIETLKKFEDWVGQTPFLSDESARRKAEKMGLTSAPREVDEIIKRVKRPFPQD